MTVKCFYFFENYRSLARTLKNYPCVGELPKNLVSEMNFLIFLIEDISLSEDVFSKAADFYVDEVSYLFKWAILTVTAILIFLVTFSILNIIKFLVIHPVELLTAHIQK